MEEDAIMAKEDQSSMWWSIAEDGRCDEDEAGPKSPNRKVNTKQYSSQRIAQDASNSLNRRGYIAYSDCCYVLSSISYTDIVMARTARNCRCSLCMPASTRGMYQFSSSTAAWVAAASWLSCLAMA